MLRWPAEWESHARTFLAWPDHEAEWKNMLEPARAAIADLARAIAAAEPVELLVARSDPGAVAARIADDRVTCRRHDYGDIWLRDTGPLMSWRDSELVAVAFRFTGWAGKFVLAGDTEVAAGIAAIAGLELEQSSLAAEGGGLETDGAGTLITTRQCLLHPGRNPGLAAADVERELAAALGIERVIWIEEGLAGDHTDGHVDNLARFVAPGRVVCAEPGAAGDPNRAVHAQIVSTLEAAGLEVATLPSPGMVAGPDGAPLPASYLNFVIANGRVVVPSFGKGSDGEAAARLEALFPGRRVASVDATALLYGGGALHCVTQPEPARS